MTTSRENKMEIAFLIIKKPIKQSVPIKKQKIQKKELMYMDDSVVTMGIRELGGWVEVKEGIGG